MKFLVKPMSGFAQSPGASPASGPPACEGGGCAADACTSAACAGDASLASACAGDSCGEAACGALSFSMLQRRGKRI
jgi:hypothetical protein